MKIRKIIKQNSFLVRPFLVLCGIYLTAISAILLANVRYADDIGRTTQGYAGWINFSRYLTSISARFLHADDYLTNIAPLPQLLAVAIMAAASLLLVCLISGKRIFKKRWTKWIWRIIAVTPLGLCPYMLECFSYQYDAPYMMISVLAVIVPFAFRKKPKWLYVITIVAGVLVACMTYQVSVGIFVALAIFLALKDWNRGKKFIEVLKFGLWSAAALLVALLFFQKVLMVPQNLYVSNETPAVGDFLAVFLRNMGEYMHLLMLDSKKLWLVICAVLAVAFVVIYVIKSKQSKIFSALLAIVGLPLMLLSVYAPYSALDAPLFEPRAMYGVGAVLAIICVYLSSTKKRQKLVIIPVVALCWCFFVFAFTYGNALKEQDAFRSSQIEMAMADINEVLPTLGDEDKKIQVVGRISYAPAIVNMPEDTRRIVTRLLKPSFEPWFAYRITEGSGFEQLIFDRSADLSKEDLRLVKHTALYDIFADNKNILVKFKGNE